MKRSFIILLFFIGFQTTGVTQFKKQLDSLCILCKNSVSDSEKVVGLGKLANLYYTYKLNRQADSVLHEQLLMADLSNNNNLLLIALFGDGITNLSPSATKQSFDNTIRFLVKGIEYAKSQNNYDYIALGYTRMAAIYKKRGQYDPALANAQQALSLLPNINSDSVKVVVYMELGNAYQAKGESVLACTNYNNAFDIALRIKSIPLQSSIYHCFSAMYLKLGNEELAKEQLKQSLKLDRENNYGEGMIRDFYDLGRVTDEKFYIDKSIEMSDSLNFYQYLLDAKRLMLIYYMVIKKNENNLALHYLETEPELKESYLNIGIAQYNQTIGNIYFYAAVYDSALHYFKLTEEDFKNHFDEKQTRDNCYQIANTYQQLKDIPHAINYYLRVIELSKKINDANGIAGASGQLSDLYKQQGDFKKAFMYTEQAVRFNDSLRNLSRAGDIALLGVEREKRKHDEEQRQEEKRLNNRQNIQYLVITISISIIFIVMLIIGTFPVSKLVIKLFGYFFFISLFEFIVLLIDNILLAKAVHGEPLKLWLIKIVLIALLVPLQHYMEHNLIKFLASRKLLHAKSKFNFKNRWNKMKKPAPVHDADIEEDTAVL